MRKLFIAIVMSCSLLCVLPFASAHGEIVETWPEQNANVVAVPNEIWIQFDGNLQQLSGKAINTLAVSDSTGVDIGVGEPLIEGGRISIKVSDQAAEGMFTVRYRIVSQDAHPVEGSYTFNVSSNIAQASPTVANQSEKESFLGLKEVSVALLLAAIGAAIYFRRKSEKK